MGLTDAQYQAGIDRIRLAIAEAEARSEEAVFSSDLQLRLVVGFLGEVLQSLSQNDCHETPTGSFEEVSGVCPHSTNVKCRENNIYNNFSAYVGVYQRMSALKFMDGSPESASKRLS
jgi:hypothetical protein